MVAVTGLGAISCLGTGVDELWHARERSGIVEGLGRVKYSGQNPALTFALTAAREAMQQAGWSELGPDDGIVLATTTGLILEWDRAFTDYADSRIEQPEFLAKFNNQPLGRLLELTAAELGNPGATSLLTSACSASTQALGVAEMWLKHKRVKRCLVLGVEVLCDLTTYGFKSLQLLSNEPSTPFDKNRKGINLSEGAAALCLEAGGKGLALFSGSGFSTDAFHMTGPHPEGEGSARAIAGALRASGLSPSAVDWVHAHGTGSQANDMAEGLAIARVFKEDAPWVSSTKWLHGHALGAAGALETVLVIRAMLEGYILRTRGLSAPDSAIAVRHPEQDIKTTPRHVLKNTLGFGGANAAVVISCR